MMNATDRASLHSSIYAYFQWLSSSSSSTCPSVSNDSASSSSQEGEKQTIGQRVLLALEKDFPELAQSDPSPESASPELEVRYAAYPIHLKRIADLEKALKAPLAAAARGDINATVSTTPNRKRKSAAADSPAAKRSTKKSPPKETRVQNKAAVPPTTEPAEVPWETRYEQLVHFQKGFGHCRVSRLYKPSPDLAYWVSRMRIIYKKIQKEKAQGRKNQHYMLTDDRIALLESIGFEWVVRKNKPKAWEQRFEELKEFKQEFGHCRVPRAYEKDPSLGEWCHGQRKDYANKAPIMMEERVHKLNAIGFEWHVERFGVSKMSWEDRFDQLVEFRRKNGDCNVPRPPTRWEMKKEKESVGDGEDQTDPSVAGRDTVSCQERSFRRWVQKQRSDYQLWKQGKTCPLDRSRIKKLEGIGFTWGKERDPSFHHRVDPETWNQHLEELRQYKDNYGDCNVPQMWTENKSLGCWVAEQRKQYRLLQAGKTSSLSSDRRVALEKLGFTWVRRDVKPRQEFFE